MHWYHTLPLLLAQAVEQAAPVVPSTPWYFSPWLFYLVALICVVALPFMLGEYIAKSLRMSDYGWKIGVILFSLALSGLIIAPKPKGFGVGWPPKLGVDLKGGVILIYEINRDGSQPTAQEDADKAGGSQVADKKAKSGQEKEAADKLATNPADEIKVTDLIEALRRRLNPGGVKEIIIRPYGERQVEIIVPEVEDAEIQRIKDLITKAGFLTFRIVATKRDHDYLIELAAKPENKDAKVIRDGENIVGLWARVAREDKKVDSARPFQVDVRFGDTIRDAATKTWIKNLPEDVMATETTGRLSTWLQEQGIQEIEVLMAADDGFNVEGKHLASVRSGFDDRVNPCINFDMTMEGSSLFGGLTGNNLPDTQADFHRRLGILLDDELLSAPRILSTISSNGRITGKFSQEEVDFLVGILRAGRLPAALNKTPLSENRIDPLLGRDTIVKGFRAIVISLVGVLVFMALYYRFAGVVACFALAINLVLILGTMIMFNAAFTLPGLAGLVLTVGMSVDANVLIYERIREELTRGSALRMAIRNGFSRATTTIVDANVTTLITAIVLYVIGTDQIRGFAVTLILGIVMSMYTAIFCSRVVFDIYERKRKATKLPMNRILGATEIDFMGKARIAIIMSLVVITIGLAGVVGRGRNIFDIDFNGGTSVTMVLTQRMDTENVRTKITAMFGKMPGNVQFTLTSINDVAGQVDQTVFKIDSSLQEEQDLKNALHDEFQEKGKSLLKSYSLKLAPLKTITIAAESPVDPAASQTPVAPSTPTPPVTTPPEKTGPAETTPPATNPAPASSDPAPPAPASPAPAPSEPPAPASPATPEPPAPASPATPAPAPQEPSAPATPAPAPSEPPADQPKPAEPKPPAADDGSPSDESNKSVLTIGGDEIRFVSLVDEPADAQPKEPAPASAQDTPADTNEKTTGEAKTDETKTPPDTSTATKSTSPLEAESSDTPSTPADVLTSVETTLDFGDHKINVPTLKDMIKKAADAIKVNAPEVTLVPEPPDPNWQAGSEIGYVSWKLTMPGDKQRAQAILNELKKEVDETAVWPSSSKIGPQVAGRMTSQAVAALTFSILGIVVYIWIRFQRAIFGLAAVVALVHDVLIMLGAIALSAWLKNVFGILLIEEFKISLPVVAAFLTVIGYSLNDTIVVFDRIREVRGKSPDLTAEMINTSINQTLSRTLLTSFTTFIVVLILYALGGQGIHGFAFALVIGVVAGTYSSVFIAAPVLLWIMGTKKPVKEKSLVA
jgi:SecD/SecF fusion protein